MIAGKMRRDLCFSLSSQCSGNAYRGSLLKAKMTNVKHNLKLQGGCYCLTNWQCPQYSRDMLDEKSKSPYSPGVGVVDTNDWSIIF